MNIKKSEYKVCVQIYFLDKKYVADWSIDEHKETTFREKFIDLITCLTDKVFRYYSGTVVLSDEVLAQIGKDI